MFGFCACHRSSAAFTESSRPVSALGAGEMTKTNASGNDAAAAAATTAAAAAAESADAAAAAAAAAISDCCYCR